MTRCDILVIGGGIAGAAAAYELAALGAVILLERESACGYHSTGRSAASFTENYGTSVIRRLVKASRGFFEAPPAGLAEAPLVGPRGMITIARADQREALDRELARGRQFAPDMHEIDLAETFRLVPALRRDYVAAAIIEPGSLDIDVHGVHQAFLKGAKARGARIVTDAEVTALERRDGAWTAVTRADTYTAEVVINAAGAWADIVGAMAGARPIGLVPKRRTAFTIDAPVGVDVAAWPLVNDVGEEFYFKPDAGRLFVSPADATPSEPCDAQPEDIDIAIGADRLQRATTIEVKRVARKWAGLRSFVADGSPVAGRDPDRAGFFWLAGQGGYGIKTSPALARAIAALVARDTLPDDLLAAGLAAADLSPRRAQAAMIQS